MFNIRSRFSAARYHENTLKKYPVLYMHHRHNVFFKEEAFVGNTLRTHEVLNMLDKMNGIYEAFFSMTRLPAFGCYR